MWNSFIVFISSLAVFGGITVTQEGYSCVASTLVQNEDGSTSKCHLQSEQEIQGLLLHRWVRFFEDGKLKQCELAEDSKLQGLEIPWHSEIFFYETGEIKTLRFAAKMEIQGIPLNGGYGKIETSFHKNGKISSCFLYRDAVIQGIPCDASPYRSVQFYENGQMYLATLSESAIIDGSKIKKGQRVAFNKKGELLNSP